MIALGFAQSQILTLLCHSRKTIIEPNFRNCDLVAVWDFIFAPETKICRQNVEIKAP
jgi:hypothetical protein